MKTQATVALSCILLLSCAATEPQKTQPQAKPISSAAVKSQSEIRIETDKPADIVNVTTLTQQIQVSMAYAGPDNFTATPVPGYQANHCYLQQKAAQAVAQVAIQAALLGYQLQLLDCYRPQRASNYFLSWVADASDQKTKAAYYPRLNKADLHQGYIAAHSGHSRASTVDLTLLRKNAAGQWRPVDMGGTYDLFDPMSHLNSTAITTEQKSNRLLLKDLMQQQGFTPYELEWWHFTLHNERYPNSYFDFVVN
ncbi:M15 family metallopeptidase [Rheinheimera tangshanensis]|uniref:D-alanyl-D-alanine dipeptidase n=1 Tax=Rheinheimera tangshanensis TaxID=400153 RepID=A0A5C8LW06_9GAMM|nr:M15 family metallopeptidase [Rheinheimera tangshanensis]TXK79889.1 M15 family metallopeptidase [Rheinheimera tangshanensis]GGM65064.1 D-alanyl-D-alanine dipeptidase [Rheinheimera tangshanensis]